MAVQVEHEKNKYIYIYIHIYIYTYKDRCIYIYIERERADYTSHVVDRIVCYIGSLSYTIDFRSDSVPTICALPLNVSYILFAGSAQTAIGNTKQVVYFIHMYIFIEMRERKK